MRAPAYHQIQGQLGVGDLHPGAEAASARLLEWLGERGVREVLEVGAGIGVTAARLRDRGYRVTATEPDPILFGRLRAVPGIDARRAGLLELGEVDRYDAVIAESVLYALDRPQSFAAIATALRAGGVLALVDAVWTERASADTAARLHDETQRRLGIPLASRDGGRWGDWLVDLEGAGFATVHQERLPDGAAGRRPPRSRGRMIRALARRPSLLWHAWRARRTAASITVPAGVLESWAWMGELNR